MTGRQRSAIGLFREEMPVATQKQVKKPLPPMKVELAKEKTGIFENPEADVTRFYIYIYNCTFTFTPTTYLDGESQQGCVPSYKHPKVVNLHGNKSTTMKNNTL
ncbi:hypothetical protein NDU88_003436 [Pleurodeles waltl]|uniref:Uncharacterized protein n=1 Tax=Pleurodeles waltl TaxID=8319 RepID=A0AAV7RDX0_PLEWA|nr:hypothetical protein NDU88_003436 [Pleurodeles waltl]